MPTYQYACTECGHAFEQFQSFTDDALTVCPVCEGRLRKVFNAVGVVFKGSGFYRNDSRSSADGPGSSGSLAEAHREDGVRDGESRPANRRRPRHPALPQRPDLRLCRACGRRRRDPGWRPSVSPCHT